VAAKPQEGNVLRFKAPSSPKTIATRGQVSSSSRRE